MAVKRKSAGQTTGFVKGIAMGVGAGVLMVLGGAMALALMVCSGWIGEEMISVGCMVIWALASASGNMIAWWCIRSKKLAVAGITSLSLYVSLLAGGLAFGGQYSGVGTAALLIAVGGGMSFIPELFGQGSGAKCRNKRRIVKLHKKYT